MTKKRSKENTRKKQEFVAKLLKSQPSASLNAVGTKVKKEFGTVLAYDKLREAFTAAGGKVDTRRGKGRGKSPKPKAAKRAKRKYGTRSPEATKAKQEFVKSLVQANSKISMNEAGKRVAAKFGSQLAFDKLKQAFTSAGGIVGKPGRRAKPRKPIARRAGRRASDQAALRIASVLKDMPRHIVVIHKGDHVDTNEFQTKEQAVSYARGRLQEGTPASNIGYYLRQPLEVSVSLG